MKLLDWTNPKKKGYIYTYIHIYIYISLMLGSGISPRGGNGNPLQYSCLENSMDRRVWWATVHETAKSWTQRAIEHTHTADSLCCTIEASTTL